MTYGCGARGRRTGDYLRRHGSQVPGRTNEGWHSGHLGFSPNHLARCSGIFSWNELYRSPVTPAPPAPTPMPGPYPVRPMDSSGKAYSGMSNCFRRWLMSVELATTSERRSAACCCEAFSSLALMDREMGTRRLVLDCCTDGFWWVAMSLSRVLKTSDLLVP